MKALAPDDPRVIGEYRLRAQLGAGGMGRVYLGLSPAGRAVAIKVVNPDLAGDAEFLHRFAQEVAAARAVSGIYTAPVVASGLNERPPWLATAFVPGPSLDQVVSENGPLPEPALWPLLAGLTEAHGGHPRVRGGAPRPQARQRAAGHRRAAGDRLRDLPGHRRDRADRGRSGVRHAGLHVTRAGRGQARRARQRHVRPGVRDRVRGRGRRAVRHRDRGRGPVPGGARARPPWTGCRPRCGRSSPAAWPRTRPPGRRPRRWPPRSPSRDHGTGPSAVAFWPRPVANVIGAYQARLEQETKGSRADRGVLAGPARRIRSTAPAAASAWPAQPAAAAVGSAGAAGLRRGPPGLLRSHRVILSQPSGPSSAVSGAPGRRRRAAISRTPGR